MYRIPWVNKGYADNEMSRVEILFREKRNTASIGGTNHTISDPIDTGG